MPHIITLSLGSYFFRLVLATEAYGFGNWISVSQLFSTRTDVQSRERYCNILDPQLNSSDWTNEEDE